MSDTNPDLQQRATEYRDKLTWELEQVEAFLAMAERLSMSNGEPRSGLLVPDLTDDGEPEPGLDGKVNVFRLGG